MNQKVKSHSDTLKENYLEVMDSADRPLAVLPETEIHRQGLLHRSIIALLYDRQFRLLLKKRSLLQELYPGRWDLSSTGHVLTGESTISAALRQMHTTFSFQPRKLKLITTLKADLSTNFEFISIFDAGRILSPLELNTREVEDIVYVTKQDLRMMVRESPEIITPAVVRIWRKDLLFPKLV
ncbi:NUDIX domain-containing protein [Desulfonatronovibrio magnus]|uniref:NUDIX domain-containing protein n=1 Tax=Desulfonatronovibrio magnus TaxID=698827 RepID=UPI0005EB21FC|nr:NUDIX domain-containing protein [Desulfonatronovibrio magnus]